MPTPDQMTTPITNEFGQPREYYKDAQRAYVAAYTGQPANKIRATRRGDTYLLTLNGTKVRVTISVGIEEVE